MTTRQAITVKGMEELRKKLDPALLGPAVIDGFEKAGDVTVPVIKSRMPTFSGRAAKSTRLTIDKTRPVPHWARIGPRAPHSHLIDLGTKAHFPPTDATSRGGRRLRRWVQRTLRPQAGMGGGKAGKAGRERAIDDATFLVARAIGRRGTRGSFFMRDAFRTVQGQISSILGAMRDQLQREWARRS